mmetsp:Transcript_144278/g.462097  ORF Transcript_144278/g.462097 Transcript_144278/m.462097 type:complete len:346 (-) Transcript_144278:954-1991(-)
MTAARSSAARCISSAMCKRSTRGQITDPLKPNRRQDCRPNRNSTKSMTRPYADPCAPRTAFGRWAICGPAETISTPFLRARWPKAPSSTDGACEPSTSDSSPCAARARPASPRPPRPPRRPRQPQRPPPRSQSRRTASRRCRSPCRRSCGHRRWDPRSRSACCRRGTSAGSRTCGRCLRRIRAHTQLLRKRRGRPTATLATSPRSRRRSPRPPAEWRGARPPRGSRGGFRAGRRAPAPRLPARVRPWPRSVQPPRALRRRQCRRRQSAERPAARSRRGRAQSPPRRAYLRGADAGGGAWRSPRLCARSHPPNMHWLDTQAAARRRNHGPTGRRRARQFAGLGSGR